MTFSLHMDDDTFLGHRIHEDDLRLIRRCRKYSLVTIGSSMVIMILYWGYLSL